MNIDDKVKLAETSEHYKDWNNYSFRVIDVDRQKSRIVRNMRNENMGSTNQYFWEDNTNLILVKAAEIKEDDFGAIASSVKDIEL